LRRRNAALARRAFEAHRLEEAERELGIDDNLDEASEDVLALYHALCDRTSRLVVASSAKERRLAATMGQSAAQRVWHRGGLSNP